MATATIELVDLPGGGVNAVVRFDPDLDTRAPTLAQTLAMEVMAHLHRGADATGPGYAEGVGPDGDHAILRWPGRG